MTESTAAAPIVERWRMPSGSIATIDLTDPPEAVQGARELLAMNGCVIIETPVLARFIYSMSRDEGSPAEHQWALAAFDGEHEHFINYNADDGWRIAPFTPTETMPAYDWRRWLGDVYRLEAAAEHLMGTGR